MTKKVWVFKNKTTGFSMECTDLGFLVHQIQFKGINLPREGIVDIVITGHMECSVPDDEGNINDVSLKEKTLTS